MKNTKPTYTQNDSIIVNTLKSAGKPLTLNELNELANSEIKPSQMTSARNKGLISFAGEVKVDRETYEKLLNECGFEIYKPYFVNENDRNKLWYDAVCKKI